MSSGTKIALYQALRTHGLRLYASRSNSVICGSCGCNFKRSMSTVSPQNDDDIGFFDRLKERMGLRGKLEYFPTTLKYSAFRLYLSAAEASRYNKVHETIQMPDTLTSWHKLTSLHIWLIMCRLITEGREGTMVKNGCIEAFIADMTEKSKVIGNEMKIKVKGEEIEILHEQFLASLLMYDEGLLGSDKELAGTVWRTLFAKKEDVNFSDIEIMVHYIRKQVAHLQRIPRKQMLTNGLIPFLPLEGNTVSKTALESLERIKQEHLQNK
ncbi:Ubiquinol-cytochrome-c reductase complex assembly factor 1 [Mactra antiquata]